MKTLRSLQCRNGCKSQYGRDCDGRERARCACVVAAIIRLRFEGVRALPSPSKHIVRIAHTYFTLVEWVSLIFYCESVLTQHTRPHRRRPTIVITSSSTSRRNNIHTLCGTTDGYELRWHRLSRADNLHTRSTMRVFILATIPWHTEKKTPTHHRARKHTHTSSHVETAFNPHATHFATRQRRIICVG